MLNTFALGFQVSVNTEVYKQLRSSSHSCHLWMAASGMMSSHEHLVLYRSCRIWFAVRMKGVRNPIGLYTELTVESIPLLVFCLFLMVSWNVNASVMTFHRRALSTGSSMSRLSYLTSFAFSSSGIEAKTVRLLLIHFVSLNPPIAHRALGLWSGIWPVVLWRQISSSCRHRSFFWLCRRPWCWTIFHHHQLSFLEESEHSWEN